MPKWNAQIEADYTSHNSKIKQYTNKSIINRESLIEKKVEKYSINLFQLILIDKNYGNE